MKKNSILVHIIFLSIIFALLHKTALTLSWYWTIEWSDSVMHTFGGFLGALIVFYVVQKIGFYPKSLPRKIILFLFVVVSVVAVGSIWELWEIFSGLSDPFRDLADTVTDLIMDTLGSIIGFLYYDKKLKPKSE